MFFGIYKTTEYSYCLKLFERGLKTPKLIKEGRQHQINANLSVKAVFHKLAYTGLNYGNLWPNMFPRPFGYGEKLELVCD